MKRACIEWINGAPALTVDGRPLGPMAFQWGFDTQEPEEAVRKRLVAMSESGITLFFPRLTLSDPQKLPEALDMLERSIGLLRECAPGALAILWLVIEAYEGFAVKYPNDVLVFNDGGTGGWLNPSFMGLKDKDTPRFTFASEAWKHEVGGMLRSLACYVSDGTLSDTVIGYFFFSHCYEWNYYWDYDTNKRCYDYSPAMQAAFRHYLIGKYRGDEALLKRAWNDPDVTFASACLPSKEQREAPDYGYFWNPAVSAPVIDYAECHNEVVAEKLEYFSKVCKEASGFNAVVGAFWGYFQNQDMLWGGHSRAKRLMDCPYLDFWSSPYTYENKQSGGFASMRYLVKSLQKHGKLFFAEADTFLHDSSESSLRHHGHPAITYRQSEALLKRDFVYPLCEDTQAWWIDWSSGTSQYEETQFKPLMRQMQDIAAKALTMPRGGVSDIAAVVDQESFLACPHGYRGSAYNEPAEKPAVTPEEVRARFPFALTQYATDRFRIHELPRLGTPVDYYETDDILDGSRHKVYIFLNFYSADATERAKIAANLKKDGNMLIFMYGAGLIYPGGQTPIGAQNVSELTGIRMAAALGEQRSRMKLTRGASDVLPGVTDGDELGDFERPIDCGFLYRENMAAPFTADPCRINPVLYVDDPDAQVLAHYISGGQAAFALKAFDDWTSVYIGSPCVQAHVLRALAKKAGAHLYVERDDAIVYANKSFIGVHVKNDGKYTIRLKEQADAAEAFTSEVLASRAYCFTDDIPGDTTRLYCITPV